MELPAFPTGTGAAEALTRALRTQDCTLRALGDGDLRWLGALYASTRGDLAALVELPPPTREMLVAQQFAIQHRGFVAAWSDADFLALEHRCDGPIGRLYLARRAPEHRLIDIAIAPEWRGRGLGRALLQAVQADARAAGCGVDLHVAHGNAPALGLYERLGFVAAEDGPVYRRMRWRPDLS